MCLLKMNRSVGLVLFRTHLCHWPLVISFLRYSKDTVQLSKFSASMLHNLKFNCSNKRNSSNLNQSGTYNVICLASYRVQAFGTVHESVIGPTLKASESTDSKLTVRALNEKQECFLESELEDKKSKASQVKHEEWDALRCSVLEISDGIEEKNIDAIIINKCCELSALLLGKSYFKYLKSGPRQINRAAYGNYLRLFYFCSADCTSDDLNEIYAVYSELTQVFPLLDCYTAEKAVWALSITEHWREYEKLLKDIKISYTPSKLTYSTVIIAAFKNKELDLGWSLIEEMLLLNQYPPDDVFMFWLQVAKDKKERDYLLRMLTFFNDFNLKPSGELCKAIKETFEGIDKTAIGTFTSVTKRGECKTCRAHLEQALVSKEDYEELKSMFLDPVLIGKDIFQKTRPEEFKEFITFLEKTAPYDIVIDGLNIALRVHKTQWSFKTFAFQLNAAVRYFAARDKKILILGRKHMMKWLGKNMKFIFNNANLFLAEDISQDDPFLLYATLYSGLGTCFVSQDLMRGHKFLLAVPKLKATFLKWQAQHQYFLKYIEPNGIAHFQMPVTFMQNIQQNSHGDWHIPYDVKENLTGKERVDNYHRYWLCVQHRQAEQPSKFSQWESRPNHYKKRKGHLYDVLSDLSKS